MINALFLLNNYMCLQINMRKVCNNAYQQYVRSRPGASAESVKRIKELCINEAGILPQYSDVSQTAADIISRMKNYRPQGVSMSLQNMYIRICCF